LNGEASYEQGPEGEIGDGESKQREDTDSTVGEVAAAMRRDNASGNGDGRTDQQSEESQLHRGGIALKDDAANGSLKFEGLAEIAVGHFPKIATVLHRQRAIEAQRVAKFGDLPWGGTFAEHLFDGITWDDVDQKKNESEHQPEGGKRKQKPVEEMARHFVAESALLSG
jgi:hypothetical protein